MKILLLEEIWLGGIESPQYFPSIREALESPSYKVNESELKIVKYCSVFVSKSKKAKKLTRKKEGIQDQNQGS